DGKRLARSDRRGDSQIAAHAGKSAPGDRAGESRRYQLKAFAYLNPVNEKDAIGALGPDRDKVMVLGGGQDLLARMKDYVAQPDRVVNIKNALDATIAATPDGGFKIGAAVKVAALAEPAR